MVRISSGMESKGIDRLLGAAVAIALLVGYAALAPVHLYGDDVFLAWCLKSGDLFTVHPLFMPLARVWAWVIAPLCTDPLRVLQLLAICSGALSGALLYSAARRFGLSRAPALLGVLFVVSASSWWFFCSVGELHAPHLAALALVLWSLARLESASPRRAHLLVGLALSALIGTHQSGLLMIPFAATLYVARTRSRPAKHRAGDLAALSIFPLLGAGGVLWLAHLHYGGAANWRAVLGGAGGEVLDKIFSRPWPVRTMVAYLGSQWALFAWAPLLLGAAGLGRLARVRPREALLVLLWIGPYAFFFAFYSYAERGAYFLPTLPALSWAALRGLIVPAAAGPWPGRRIEKLSLGTLLLLAALGSWAIARDLLADLPTSVLLLLPAAAAGIACALPPRSPGWRRGPFLATLALVVLVQIAASAKTMRGYDASRPLRRWAADAIATVGTERSYLITDGFSNFYYLQLEKNPGPEPITLTSLGEAGLSPAQVEGYVRRLLEGGASIHIDIRLLSYFKGNPILAHILEVFPAKPEQRGLYRGLRLSLAKRK